MKESQIMENSNRRNLPQSTRRSSTCLFSAHHLHHEVYESLVLVAGDWGVGPDHQSAVHLGRQVHVLTWRAREGSVHGAQTSTVLHET